MWKFKADHLVASIVYSAFFALIGFAVWVTKSGMPLWCLLFMPSLSYKEDKPKNEVSNEDR